MKKTRNFRPPFLDAAALRRGAGRREAYVDASCEFVASRTQRVNGVPLEAGASFDKTQVDERRLRQLYDARAIALAPESEPVAPPPRKLAVGPTDLIHTGLDGQRPPIKQRVARRRLQTVEAV